MQAKQILKENAYKALSTEAFDELLGINNAAKVLEAKRRLLSYGTQELIDTHASDLFVLREDSKIVFRKAAIGSLVWSRTGEVDIIDRVWPAVIYNHERTIASYSIKRGTNECPPHSYGIAIEVESKKGAVCPTQVQEVVLRNADHAAQLIHEYVDRETVSGIYRFGLLPNYSMDGSFVGALTCLADPASKLYIGNRLGLDHKARIMASAMGIGGKEKKGMTCLQYFLAFAKTFAEANATDHHINAIIIHAVRHRLAMPQDVQKRLAEVEKFGGFDGEEPSIDNALQIFRNIYGQGLSLEEMEDRAINTVLPEQRITLLQMRNTP